jgi:hypothetical protein
MLMYAKRILLRTYTRETQNLNRERNDAALHVRLIVDLDGRTKGALPLVGESNHQQKIKKWPKMRLFSPIVQPPFFII